MSYKKRLRQGETEPPLVYEDYLGNEFFKLDANGDLYSKGNLLTAGYTTQFAGTGDDITLSASDKGKHIFGYNSTVRLPPIAAGLVFHIHCINAGTAGIDVRFHAGESLSDDAGAGLFFTTAGNNSKLNFIRSGSIYVHKSSDNSLYWMIVNAPPGSLTYTA